MNVTSEINTTNPLPYDGEWNFAKNKKHDEVVVFVHHFGGSKRTLLRHMRLMNDLGYDCVRFNLKYNKVENPTDLSLLGDFRLGLRRVWKDQIQDILNLIPQKKILFAFSMPCVAAIAAISERRAYDIQSLICDSGPFLNIVSSTWKLYQQLYQVQNKVRLASLTALSFMMWGADFKSEVQKYFLNIPAGFSILSIRGAKDPLVPPEAIRKLFALQTHLNLKVLNLPQAHHLDGLKTSGSVYTKEIQDFLMS